MLAQSMSEYPTVSEAQDYILDCHNIRKQLLEIKAKTGGFRFTFTVEMCERRDYLLSLPNRTLAEDNELNKLDWRYRVHVNDTFQLYE
jgi:hypothetical protein